VDRRVDGDAGGGRRRKSPRPRSAARPAPPSAAETLKRKKNSTSFSHPLHKAFIWQLAFATPATALPALERTLSLDDRVLRSVVLKRRAPGGPAPTPAAVARRARAALAGQAAGAALAGHTGPPGQRQ
jgi:hypothetical protein